MAVGTQADTATIAVDNASGSRRVLSLFGTAAHSEGKTENSQSGPMLMEEQQATTLYPKARSIHHGVGDFSFAQDPTILAPNWGGPTGAGTVHYDSLYENIEMFRCTDANTDPNNINTGYAVGIGGSGSRVSWNRNDTMLNVNARGGNTIVEVVDTANDQCKVVCLDGSRGGCTTENYPYTFGLGFFSKVHPEAEIPNDPNVFYSWTWDGRNSTKVYKVTIPDAGVPSATLLVDFSPALYMARQKDWPGSPSNPNHSVGLGEVIEPTRKNNSSVAGHYPLFQAITGGTTGTTEPNFAQIQAPSLASTHTPLPLQDWEATSFGARAKIFPAASGTNPYLWIFQTAAGGTAAPPEPDWSTCSTSCKDGGGVTWTNRGATATVQDGSVTWVKIGRTQNITENEPYGVENADDSFGKGISVSGGQDTGIFALIYKISTQTIYQYNTYSKIETDFVCTDNGPDICPSTSATWTPRTVGIAGKAVPSLTFHDMDLSQNGATLNMVDGHVCQFSNDSYCQIGGQQVLWTTGSATVVTSILDWQGHSAIGNLRVQNDSDSGGPYTGTWEEGRLFTDLTPYKMLAYSTSTCIPQGGKPSQTYPWCFPQQGAHWSWANNKGEDQEPIIGTTYDLGLFPATSIFQNEIVGFSSCGMASEPSCPASYPANTQWRFGRTFAYQTDSANLNSWATIGALSQTGKYFALTSTGFCTMGTGGDDYAYTDGGGVAAETIILPHLNNTAHNAFYTVGGGTAGSGEPDWNHCATKGQTCSDGTALWLNIGSRPMCGWEWSSKATGVSYTCGALGTASEIVPFYQENVGAYAYHATQTGSGCTQGMAPPVSWCQTIGCSVIDNGITWINDGPTNGRSDVLIYKLE